MNDHDVEAVYRRHGARIERALIGSFGDRQLAGDATAQAFVELLGHRGQVRRPDAWVWRSAFAIARGLATTSAPTYGLAPPDEGRGDQGVPIDLFGALAELSPMQRQAVVLHHYGGWPIREVAAMTGSTTNAVKVHLFRGRGRLRDLLGEENADA